MKQTPQHIPLFPGLALTVALPSLDGTATNAVRQMRLAPRCYTAPTTDTIDRLAALLGSDDCATALIRFGYAGGADGYACTVTEAARWMANSRRGITRRMRDRLDCTPVELLRLGRLLRVLDDAERLANLRGADAPRRPCEKLAAAAGFTDQFQLSNWLDRHFGFRPSQLFMAASA